jgi:hypothetical protein
LVSNFGERYPDVFLDVNNDKNIVWSTDDWWLHASYNDCEGNGLYNVWSSCQPSHPGWNANNFPLSSPGIIEIEINYSKIGMQNSISDTIGIGFEVSDTYTNYHYFPASSLIGNPSTWATGIVSYNTNISGIDNNKRKLKIFPNPSGSSIKITFPNPENEKYSLIIYNSTGQLIETFYNISGNEVSINNKILEKGMYFFKIQNKSGIIGQDKFIIE